MKDQILKLAGVKTDKEFYKLFPSEEAFMKVHGKEFKKAQTTNAIKKAQYGVNKLNTDTNKNGIPDYLENNPTMSPNQFMSGNNNIDSFYQYNQSTPYPGSMFKGNQIPQNNYVNIGKPPVDMSDPQAPSFQNMNMPYNQDIGFMQQATEAKLPKDAPLGGSGAGDFLTKNAPYVNAGMDVLQGASMIKGQRNAKKQAKQDSLVTAKLAEAAESVDVDAQRQRQDYASRKRNDFMTPIVGESLFPVIGVGTNPLAQHGGEIQNTYDPYDIYDDGGYEPLNDADKVKTYQMGGQSAGDIAGQFEPFATNLSNTYINQGGQADAGSMIGGGIGGAAGMAFGGPLGAAIGKFAGSTIGGLIDTTDRDIKKFQNESQRNIGRITGQAFGKSIQAQNASYMEDGGYVSNDWTPQVIAKFGDHSAEDYYNYAHEYDTLRAGGSVKSEHYTPVSARGLETAALGGSVKTLWGGEVRPISYNPYMPNSGETVNFYGQSHDDGGIGVKYGEGGEVEQGEEANVEVERGEPSFEMIDPKTGKPTLNVLGDRKVHASFAKQLGDPELVKLAKQYDGKKFKNIGLELSKKENKYTSLIDKATKELDDLTPKNQFDKLKFNALEKNIEGAHLGLKQIADTKMTLTHFQNAINDTADELGESLGKDISSSNLNKGKVMFGKDKGQIAKYGAAIEKAQVGTYKVKGNLPGSIDYNTPDEAGDQYKGTNYETVWTPKVQKAFNDPTTASKLIADLENYSGEDAADVKAQLAKEPNLYRKIARAYELATDHKVGPYHTLLNGLIDKNTAAPTTTPTTTPKPVEEDKVYDVKANKRNPWIDLGNQALKYFRPSDAEGLDPNQLYGELNALASNKEEPVQAQFYHPELDVPYDISLQDQINEVTAGSRAAQRMVGYNPAAQAEIAAQAYEPINKIKGEQFRLNQAKKDQVYAGNRATLNDAQLKNLGIADTQYVRGEQTASNKRMIDQSALNSITSKYQQNKLDNRTLQTYENIYNYRFGKDFVADNYNGVSQFNMPNVYDKGDEKANMVPIYNEDDEVTGFKKIAKNGTAIKKSNGSIVSAYKRL